ncbi:hypothetical protein EGR_05769 [Echinococcus granulosus]|uniref:Uncharacterized protein n=1 Tax=Echinococcus granulosus TaxID=6210 RepID=W6UDJ9_ECHGR|nr:hypothetical protein EGR_05769 [Echinococcus granulosus]EUB59415.1 hypothetical protein EGR_05769 [Echinococcus granulosus]
MVDSWFLFYKAFRLIICENHQMPRYLSNEVIIGLNNWRAIATFILLSHLYPITVHFTLEKLKLTRNVFLLSSHKINAQSRSTPHSDQVSNKFNSIRTQLKLGRIAFCNNYRFIRMISRLKHSELFFSLFLLKKPRTQLRFPILLNDVPDGHKFLCYIIPPGRREGIGLDNRNEMAQLSKRNQRKIGVYVNTTVLKFFFVYIVLLFPKPATKSTYLQHKYCAQMLKYSGKLDFKIPLLTPFSRFIFRFSIKKCEDTFESHPHSFQHYPSTDVSFKWDRSFRENNINLATPSTPRAIPAFSVTREFYRENLYKGHWVVILCKFVSFLMNAKLTLKSQQFNNGSKERKILTAISSWVSFRVLRELWDHLQTLIYINIGTKAATVKSFLVIFVKMR